jgi:hypothetical protein
MFVACFCFFTIALVFVQSQSTSARPATAAPAQKSERLLADTPETTVRGNAFVAPKDWSIQVKGPANGVFGAACSQPLVPI